MLGIYLKNYMETLHKKDDKNIHYNKRVVICEQKHKSKILKSRKHRNWVRYRKESK